MGCICSQTVKNQDLNTAPDNQSKNLGLDDENKYEQSYNHEIMVGSKVTFKESHISDDISEIERNSKFPAKDFSDSEKISKAEKTPLSPTSINQEDIDTTKDKKPERLQEIKEDIEESSK